MFGMAMEPVAIAFDRKFNAPSNISQFKTPPLFAEDIARFVIVIIPSLLLSSLLLYHLCGLTKRSGVKPLSFLYVCVCILCIVGPTGYGVVSLVYDLRFPFAVQCSAIDGVSVFVYVVGHTMLCFSIGMVAASQFMTVNGLSARRVLSVRNVAVTYLALWVFVLCINVIFFCAICVQARRKEATLSAIHISTTRAAWGILMFALALIGTIAFSILTYLKAKKGILEVNKRILKSIALVSTFNVLQYAILRLIGIVLYVLSYLIDGENGVTGWILFISASLIADLSYPFAAFSIFIVHSKLRKMVCCCSNNLTPDLE